MCAVSDILLYTCIDTCVCVQFFVGLKIVLILRPHAAIRYIIICRPAVATHQLILSPPNTRDSYVLHY